MNYKVHTSYCQALFLKKLQHLFELPIHDIITWLCILEKKQMQTIIFKQNSGGFYMSKLVGNAIFGQSGGPTSVINASAAGVFTEALRQTGVIENVYGAANGIVGILNEKFYDMGQEDPAELELLKTTPSSALGSCRYKLADLKDDDTDYKRLLEVFKKYNIRYFFYNGGNDSMDRSEEINQFMNDSGWEMRVMGVPKTIDNDLNITDHSPGYGSAARYVATT